MLANYDAIAVADIMGIAFLRSAGEAAAPAARVARARGAAKRLAEPREAGVAIVADDTTMLVIECAAANGGSAHPTSRQLSSPTAVFIEKAVEKGLPRTALRHVAEWLAGGDKAKAAALEWGVVPKTTLERRDTRLSPQESERTERVARLSVHARRALGSAEEARAFMTTPHPELDGRSPVDAAKTDLGTRRAEQLLNALEYGLAI